MASICIPTLKTRLGNAFLLKRNVWVIKCTQCLSQQQLDGRCSIQQVCHVKMRCMDIMLTNTLFPSLPSTTPALAASSWWSCLHSTWSLLRPESTPSPTPGILLPLQLCPLEPLLSQAHLLLKDLMSCPVSSRELFEPLFLL